MDNFNFYLNTLYKLANQAIKVNELPISAIIVDPKTKKITPGVKIEWCCSQKGQSF